MKNSLLTLVAIVLIMLSCKTEKVAQSTPLEVDLIGSWEYLGFGRSLMIGDSLVQKFHLTSAGNVPLSGEKRETYFDYYTLVPIAIDTIQIKDGVKSFTLVRTDIDYTKNVKEDLNKDPEYNFEILWSTFNEQYSYFKERNIDWSKSYEKYRPQVTAETSELKLFLVFEKMLNEIDDGHVSIDVPDELEEAYEAIKPTVEDLNSEDANKLGNQVKDLIIEKHVKNPRSFNRGQLQWGLVNDNVAYLQIKNMVAMAHYDIQDSLGRDEFWEQWWGNLNEAKNHHDDIRIGTQFMMNSIVRDIKGTKTMIIDLRFNGGGFDDASLEILNHFAENKTDFVTKKARQGDGFTKKEIMTMIPSKELFDGDVYILTSFMTASAAEIFVLGGKVLPNTKIMGSSTEGIFSDILKKKLPNGWSFGLSNLVYESIEGVSYENIGIAPDYQLDYPSSSKDFYQYLFEDLQDGDNAIELVIAEMKKK